MAKLQVDFLSVVTLEGPPIDFRWVAHPHDAGESKILKLKIKTPISTGTVYQTRVSFINTQRLLNPLLSIGLFNHFSAFLAFLNARIMLGGISVSFLVWVHSSS
jgi:hypothetical protein